MIRSTISALVLAGAVAAGCADLPAASIEESGPRTEGAQGSAGENNRAAPRAAGRLMVDTTFVPESATIIRQFVVSDRVLIASFDYQGPLIENPYTDAAKPSYMHQTRTALAAWTLDGRALWRQDSPRAYKLELAGSEVALAYDGGGVHSERGIIWFDVATGKQLRRTKLEGRPLDMRYYSEVRLLVLMIMPQHRLETMDGAWMEVAAYDAEGRPAWRWKKDGPALSPLRMDGSTLVVGASYGPVPAAIRLDPATGRLVWSAPWNFDEPVKASPGPEAPLSHESLVMLPMSAGARFLDLANGQPAADVPLPEIPRRGTWTVAGQGDRVYVTSDDLKSITLAAYRFPSGQRIWVDETGTVSYFGPAAWGSDVAFMARRLSGGLVGQAMTTELRVYGPQGDLLGYVASDSPDGTLHWMDNLPIRVVGDRIYAAASNAVLAIRLQAK